MLILILLPVLAIVFFCATVYASTFMKKHKFKRTISVVAFCLFVLCNIGFIYQEPIYRAECEANRMQDMQQVVGITNDTECQMIISQSINTTSGLYGTMFLFTGSINGTMQDNLRMGYVAPNGASYIINVPIEKVIFIQKENVLPSGSFHFTDWQKDWNLQINVDKYLDKITINLTPKEFQKLIQ